MRLVATLAGAGALAGFLLVFVHDATQPRILAHKAKVLRQAVGEVLHEPARTETLYVHDGALHAELPAGLKEKDVEKVYRGFDAQGKSVGFAIVAGEPGFQDTIRLIFGYDPQTRQVLGMRVLESKETPGLGDKIEKDLAFVGQFEGRLAPLAGVRAGQGEGKPQEVDMITGATISSRAVVRIINHAQERLAPLLEKHAEARR